MLFPNNNPIIHSILNLQNILLLIILQYAHNITLFHSSIKIFIFKLVPQIHRSVEDCRTQSGHQHFHCSCQHSVTIYGGDTHKTSTDSLFEFNPVNGLVCLAITRRCVIWSDITDGRLPVLAAELDEGGEAHRGLFT